MSIDEMDSSTPAVGAVSAVSSNSASECGMGEGVARGTWSRDIRAIAARSSSSAALMVAVRVRIRSWSTEDWLRAEREVRAGIGREGVPKEETERTDLAETEAMECVREWIGPKVCVLGVGEAGTAGGKALIVAVIRASGSEREVEEEAEER